MSSWPGLGRPGPRWVGIGRHTFHTVDRPQHHVTLPQHLVAPWPLRSERCGRWVSSLCFQTVNSSRVRLQATEIVPPWRRPHTHEASSGTAPWSSGSHDEVGTALLGSIGDPSRGGRRWEVGASLFLGGIHTEGRPAFQAIVVAQEQNRRKQTNQCVV